MMNTLATLRSELVNAKTHATRDVATGIQFAIDKVSELMDEIASEDDAREDEFLTWLNAELAIVENDTEQDAINRGSIAIVKLIRRRYQATR